MKGGIVAGLLSILFIAALVGVFKPYVKGTKRWHFGVAAFAFLIFIGAVAEPPKDQNQAGDKAASTATQAAQTLQDERQTEPSKSQEPESEWTYSSDKDEMRGAESRYAQLDAANTIHLDFPYGEQRGQILVRQSAKYGFDILIGVPSGQVLCSSFQDTYINVKFDDGPIQRYRCTDARDGTSNMVFVQGAKGFLAKLMKSRQAIVEMEFFQNGVQQMTFHTANLKWGN